MPAAPDSHLHNDIQSNEFRFRSLIDNAPVATCLFVGPDMTIEVANDLMLSYWGKDRSILGLPLKTAVPELVNQPFLNILDEVYRTGKTYHSAASAADLPTGGKPGTYYFNFTYKPLFDENGDVYAIIDMAVDVTEEVKAKALLNEARQRSALAIELAEVGVFEVNLQLDESTGDERFYHILGMPSGLKRAEYLRFVDPRDLPVRQRAYEELHHSGNLDYCVRLNLPGHPQKWVRVKARVVRDHEQQPSKLIGLVQDITMQKAFEQSLEQEVHERTAALEEAQRLLQTSNEYLQRVIDNFESAFAALVPVMKNEGIADFRFQKANLAYSAYAGSTPGALENRLVSDFFPGYLETEVFEKYVETFTTGKENTWELHYHADGLDVHLRVTARRLQDELIIQFINFTTLKNLEHELLRKIDELQRTNRNLEEFAYAASHDLKEPIRKLLFFADMLHKSLREKLSDREEHHFSRMEAAGRRMFSLVEDLLSYSQINQQFTLAPVDLNEIVSLVLGDLELQIAQKRAVVKVKTLFTLQGHARSLQQVFQNLISNALKYSAPERQPVITIVCSVMAGKDIPLALPLREQQLAYYVVAVTDNGIGFQQADATRIFDVFTRLHGNEAVKGTGVGLAIVRKVMENHRGFVRAESEIGEGSCFYLYFPRSAGQN